MNLTLYGHYLSSSTERVRIALALKKVDYRSVSIRDIGWDAYEKISPARLMPALEVDGTLFTQSNAILHFVEETWTAPALLPQDPLIRARARAFGQQIAADIHPLDVRRVRRFLQGELGVTDDGIDRWQAHWSDLGFSSLEAMLEMRDASTPFAFGNSPGWADLHLVPHMRKYVTRFGLDPDKYPLLSALYSRCINLQVFADAAPTAQPDFTGDLEDPDN